MTVDIIDHSAEVKARLKSAIEAALEACGAQATSHVVQILTKDAYKNPADWYQRTGALKKFSHKVNMDEKAVYVGTNASSPALRQLYPEVRIKKQKAFGKIRKPFTFACHQFDTTLPPETAEMSASSALSAVS